LLSIDLDRFKAINDRHGHLAGDKVLARVGERIRQAIRVEDFAARIGGDEFAILLTGPEASQRADRTWKHLLSALRQPIQIEGITVSVGASVGIAIGPADGMTLSEIRNNADLALYRCKADGRGRASFFCAEMDAAAKARRGLERELVHALNVGDIKTAYQPVISTASGHITSVEALARWHHAERGAISPSLFVPVAEEIGVIEILGNAVLKQACIDALAWPTHVAVAVNVSTAQIKSSSFLEYVKDTLNETGLRPGRLQLEITESLFIDDEDRSFKVLTALQNLGVQILMDDFGTGYSSLAYFERFSFNKVKIDRSFVDKFLGSPRANGIVKAVVGLGKALGMAVVAEGVETEAQRVALTAVGCSHLQGYFFSRPIPALAMAELLARTRP